MKLRYFKSVLIFTSSGLGSSKTAGLVLSSLPMTSILFILTSSLSSSPGFRSLEPGLEPATDPAWDPACDAGLDVGDAGPGVRPALDRAVPGLEPSLCI